MQTPTVRSCPSAPFRLWFLAFALALGLAGCATLPEQLPRGAPGHAPPPQPGGALADAENALHARLGAEDSAWRALDANEDGLRWRLALVDSAQHTLDLQYYFWWESAGVKKSAVKLQGRRLFRHPASRIPVRT